MSEFRMDGYVNQYTRYGTSQDSSEAYEYLPESAIPDITLVSHYETNGLFAKIIDTPAEEAIKHGFDLALNDAGCEQYIKDTLDMLDWENKAATAIKWARLFGGALIVMMIDDGGELTDPVDWNAIRSIDELRVYERPVVQPDWANLYNTAGRDGLHRRSKFGMPQYYQVSSIYGSFVVHESRCLLFRNGNLPEYTMTPEYRFWGMPEYSRIRRALREVSTSHGHATRLMERMVQAIYKQRDLASTLQREGGDDEVMQRLRLIDRARSFLSTIVIDADGEEYDFKTFQLSGIKDILEANCNILSAVTNIPQTILFGRSPAGENSTGASDLENYYNFIERIQKMMLRDNLLTVLDAAFRAGASNGEIEQVPDYKLTFDPLWSLSETDQAMVDQTKAATALTRAQTAQLYVDMQVIDPSEVRKGLASTEEFNIEELLDDQEGDPLDWGLGQIPENGLPVPSPLPTDGDARNDSAAGCTAAATIVVKGGKALIGRRRDGAGWCGPGGHIEAGETPEQAARREAWEEFRIRLGSLTPLAKLDNLPQEYGVPFVFLCTDFDGDPQCDGNEMQPPHRFEELSECLSDAMFPPFVRSVQTLLSELTLGGTGVIIKEVNSIDDRLDFKESDHPRDEDGKFTSGSSGGGSSKASGKQSGKSEAASKSSGGETSKKSGGQSGQPDASSSSSESKPSKEKESVGQGGQPDATSGSSGDEPPKASGEQNRQFSSTSSGGNSGSGRKGFVEGSKTDIETAVKTGRVKMALKSSAQSKHRKGSPKYEKAVASGKKVSTVSISNTEIKKLVAERSGSGTVYVNRKTGQIKETIDCGKPVGEYISASGAKSQTTRLTIHHSKDGFHAVPASRGGKKK